VTAGAWNIGTGTALAARFGFSAAGVASFDAEADSPATDFLRRVRTFFSAFSNFSADESVGSLAIFDKPQIRVKSFLRSVT
jgi:hypothetical protein